MSEKTKKIIIAAVLVAVVVVLAVVILSASAKNKVVGTWVGKSYVDTIRTRWSAYTKKGIQKSYMELIEGETPVLSCYFNNGGCGVYGRNSSDNDKASAQPGITWKVKGKKLIETTSSGREYIYYIEGDKMLDAAGNVIMYKVSDRTDLPYADYFDELAGVIGAYGESAYN